MSSATQTGARTDRVVIPAGTEGGVARYRSVPARITGDLMFISGQIGSIGADGELVADAAEQARNALAALGDVLAEAGCTFGDVVEITTYHTGGWQAAEDTFVPVKADVFPEPYPAWTAVGVTDLAYGAVIEIAAVARIPQKD